VVELSRPISLNVLHIRKELTLLRQRQSRAAFQCKQALFTALKSMTSPRRPHATWDQTAPHPPPKTDPQSFSSSLVAAKTLSTLFNIQNTSHSLRSLALQLQTISDPLSKVMLVLELLLLVSRIHSKPQSSNFNVEC
jgi:hypothetical protein